VSCVREKRTARKTSYISNPLPRGNSARVRSISADEEVSRGNARNPSAQPRCAVVGDGAGAARWISRRREVLVSLLSARGIWRGSGRLYSLNLEQLAGLERREQVSPEFLEGLRQQGQRALRRCYWFGILHVGVGGAKRLVPQFPDLDRLPAPRLGIERSGKTWVKSRPERGGVVQRRAHSGASSKDCAGPE